MNKFTLVVLLSAAFVLGLRPTYAQATESTKAVTVLASVHPLALVAASVVPLENMKVLLPEGMTPHDFSLRPSDVAVIQNADVIVWAGAKAEPYLASFARRWPNKVWIDVSTFKTPSDPNDPHWWMSASMMMKAQAALAQALKVDAGSFAVDVKAALARADQQLAPVRERGFFVFHRAYDHWVYQLKLKQLGAFTISPEHKPGAKTLQRMREQLAHGDVKCVFSEPEFSPALVDSATKGIEVKRGELDPMAAQIALAKDGYVQLIDDMTQRFITCLAP